jgi:hypothetical protein
MIRRADALAGRTIHGGHQLWYFDRKEKTDATFSFCDGVNLYCGGEFL